MKSKPRTRRNDKTSREWNTYTVATEALSIPEVRDFLEARRATKQSFRIMDSGRMKTAVDLAFSGINKQARRLTRKQKFEEREARRAAKREAEDIA